MNPRSVAAQCIYKVIYQGKSLTEVLQHDSITTLENTQRALAKDLCFGSLRWHYALNQILDRLLVKPLKKRDKDIECLLRVGIYQLQYQHTADHAAVNETVKACKTLNKPWSKGLINGVLRGFIRDKENIVKKIKPHTLFPLWLIKRIKQAWPEHWKDILLASNKHAPMTLRVNHSQTSTLAYLTQLEAAGISATPHPCVDTAIELKQAMDVQQLPDFNKGAVSVQDASAQLAAKLLNIEPGMRVLDACAAPGGKTGHIAETAHAIDLTAIDNVAARLQKVKQNMDRLGKTVKLVLADANDVPGWHKGQAFDRILLDAPCSALGIMHRHPDIKILRQDEDIDTLVKQQSRLLATLWKLLKKDGLLLYATCSILPEENHQQISHFMRTHEEEARVIPLEGGGEGDKSMESANKIAWGIDDPHTYGRQILPYQHNMDGFYYCLLQKIA